MDKNDDSHGEEVEWIDALVATLHPEAINEEGPSKNMHGSSVDLVEDESLALRPICLSLFSKTRVNHQAESQEE